MNYIEKLKHEAKNDIKSNKDVREVVYNYWNDFVLPVFWENILFQNWNKEIDEVTIYYVLKIFSMIKKNNLVVGKIKVNGQANPNCDIVGNNNILDSLISPFSGYFIGDTNIGDGKLQWDNTIELFLQTNDIYNYMEIPKGRVPLEIGYTNVITTFYHLAVNGGLARLPYNCNFITLIMVG